MTLPDLEATRLPAGLSLYAGRTFAQVPLSHLKYLLEQASTPPDLWDRLHAYLTHPSVCPQLYPKRRRAVAMGEPGLN